MPSSSSRRFRLPRTVWVFGFTAMFMDAGSEIAHAVLPLFLVGSLGASTAMVGLIDGLAEATASITKIFSGALSDFLGRRKWLAACGYGLSALAKVIFPLASTPWMVFAGRMIDRFGKGMRGAPRDALLADWVEAAHRGYAYGLRQALDNTGNIAGPLLALLLLKLYDNDFPAVLWWALLPSFLAFAIMTIGVQEVVLAPTVPEIRRFPLHVHALRSLGHRYWVAMLLLFLLLLPRCSEAFLILRVHGMGFPLALSPLALVVMNAVSIPVTFYAGIVSDRFGRAPIIALGFACLVMAELVLGLADEPWGVWLGAGLWGLHVGLTDGVFAALVADLAPAHLRGTAFGVFNLMAGVAVFLASFLMGLAWDYWGADTAFHLAAAVGAVALVPFLYLIRRHHPALIPPRAI